MIKIIGFNVNVMQRKLNVRNAILSQTVRTNHRVKAQTKMLSCLVTRPDLPELMFDMLRPHCALDIWQSPTIMPSHQLVERIKGKEALLCTLSDRIDSQVLNAATNTLRVIATLSVGYDHIDIEECRKRGIAVGNTPDVLTDAVAELTISLLLATARRLFEAEKALRK